MKLSTLMPSRFPWHLTLGLQQEIIWSHLSTPVAVALQSLTIDPDGCSRCFTWEKSPLTRGDPIRYKTANCLIIMQHGHTHSWLLGIQQLIVAYKRVSQIANPLSKTHATRTRQNFFCNNGKNFCSQKCFENFVLDREFCHIDLTLCFLIVDANLHHEETIVNGFRLFWSVWSRKIQGVA